jgi:hypothetical protein
MNSAASEDLFPIFPNAKEQIATYNIKNLGTLRIEGVHDIIVSTVIPRLARLRKMGNEEATAGITGYSIAEDANDNDDASDAPTITTIIDVDEQLIASFLKSYGLKSLSFTSAAWRWMRLLNFKYDSRKKSFYVYGQERETVVVT